MFIVESLSIPVYCFLCITLIALLSYGSYHLGRFLTKLFLRIRSKLRR